MGGRLTDLCGHPLCVYEEGPEGFASVLRPVSPERRNELGFVATGPESAISHRELIRRPGHAASNMCGRRLPPLMCMSSVHVHVTCICMHMHMFIPPHILPAQAARDAGADAVPRRRGSA